MFAYISDKISITQARFSWGTFQVKIFDENRWKDRD